MSLLEGGIRSFFGDLEENLKEEGEFQGLEGGPAILFLDAAVGILIANLEGDWKAIKLRSNVFSLFLFFGKKEKRGLDFGLHQSLTVYFHLITN